MLSGASLYGMEPSETNDPLITLIANDNKSSVQVPKSKLGQTILELLGNSIANEQRTAFIPCSFVNANGLPYLKQYLESESIDEKNTIIQRLIAHESVETIYGLHKYMDCWGMLPKYLDKEILERRLNNIKSIRQIKLSSSNCGYIVTHYGLLMRITIDNTVETLFSDKNEDSLHFATRNDNSTVYFGGFKGVLHAYNTQRNTIDQYPQELVSIHDIVVSPDDSFILVADHCWINICDNSFKTIGKLFRHVNRPILITPDSQCIVTYNENLYIADKNANIIKTASYNWGKSEWGKLNVNFFAFAYNNTAIVASSEQRTAIFDLSLNLLAELPKHTHSVTYMHAYNNCIVVGDEKGRTHIWQFDPLTNSVTLIKTMEYHNDEINNIVFSPDGKLIACAGADQKTILIDYSGNLIDSWQMKGDRGKNCMCFSPDGEYLFVSKEKTIIRLVHKLNVKQLPLFLQHKVLHQYRHSKESLMSLCKELEQEGFQVNQIKNYFVSLNK